MPFSITSLKSAGIPVSKIFYQLLNLLIIIVIRPEQQRQRQQHQEFNEKLMIKQNLQAARRRTKNSKNKTGTQGA